MIWGIASFMIVLCSIMFSVYVFRVKKSKKLFWSTLTLAGTNLFGGILFSIYILFIIGLMLLFLPVLIIFIEYIKKGKEGS